MLKTEIKIEDKTRKGVDVWADGLAEYGKLEKVLLHPPGLETHLASLDPTCYRFLIPDKEGFNYEVARMQHRNLIEKIGRCGVQVILASDLAKNISDEELGSFVNFNSSFTNEEREWLLNYYRYGDREMDLLLSGLSVNRTGMSDRFSMNLHVEMNNPAGAYHFMRDSSFQVGNKSHVVTSMAYNFRRKEASITETLFRHSEETNVIYKVSRENTIEGGEVMPMGDTLLIGVGSERTKNSSVFELMENNAVGHSNVDLVVGPDETVLKQIQKNNSESLKKMGKVNKEGKPEYLPIDAMHLDTYFNLFSENKAIIFEEILHNDRIKVLQYERKNGYYLKKEVVTLKQYLKEKGIEAYEINVEQQLNMVTNGLTVDRNHYLAISGKLSSEAHLDGLKDFGIRVDTVNLRETTKGQGGAHCMTQPLQRRKV